MPKINYQGREVEGTEIEFLTRREDWNEYQLTDGSIVKLKIVVSDVYRLEGEYDREGNPVYLVKSSNVVSVKAPDALKKRTE